jgi:hypothetical protein
MDSTTNKILGGLASVMTITAGRVGFAEFDAPTTLTLSFPDSAIACSMGNIVTFSEDEASPASVRDSISLPLKRSKIWSRSDQKKFDALATKLVLHTISTEEKRLFAQLKLARKQNMPSRNADEIMRSAQQDNLLKEMNEILKKYAKFIGSGTSPQNDHAAWYPEKAQPTR